MNGERILYLRPYGSFFGWGNLDKSEYKSLYKGEDFKKSFYTAVKNSDNFTIQYYNFKKTFDREIIALHSNVKTHYYTYDSDEMVYSLGTKNMHKMIKLHKLKMLINEV